MKKHLYKFLCYTLVLVPLIFIQCSKDTWDKHYNTSAGQNNLRNVITGLKEKGYNAFASALEKLKLDSTLNLGMQYTIFVVPDEAFKSVADTLTGYNLSFFVLNHILGGKIESASIQNNAVYTALAGEMLFLTSDSVASYNKKWVKFVKKDIGIPDAVVYELASPINLSPDILHEFSTYYPFLYSFYNGTFLPTSTQYPQILGLTPSGLVIDSVQPKIFQYTSTSNNWTFLVSKDGFAMNNFNRQLNNLLPYFIGADYLIKNDLQNNIFLRHIITQTVFNASKDSVKLTSLPGITQSFPVSKMNIVQCNDANKLIVMDTLLYTYPVRKFKSIDLTNYLSNSLTGYNGAFKNITAGALVDNNGASYRMATVNWSTPPQVGDYLECSFPADSIYSRIYDIRLEYGYKSSYVKVKIYIDGDSLQNRIDLGSKNAPAQKITGRNTDYRLLIGRQFSIKKYQTHTIRFEIVGIKGTDLEIMNLQKLTFTLNN